MAHFAKIENGIVTNVVVVDDINESNGQEFLNSIGLRGIWIQTSYNNNIRKKFAGIGDVYNEELDRFEPSCQYPSWIWNEELYCYEPPVPYPTIDKENPKTYTWDEPTQSWKLVEETINAN